MTRGKKTKTAKTKEGSLNFPASVLKPVYDFLSDKLSLLYRRKATISTEDPFNDESRTVDNAATDTEAEEQFGHARVEAIEKELNQKTAQIRKALSRIKAGKYGLCEDCGEMIDTDRLAAYPEATLCARCQLRREK